MRVSEVVIVVGDWVAHRFPYRIPRVFREINIQSFIPRLFAVGPQNALARNLSKGGCHLDTGAPPGWARTALDHDVMSCSRATA